MSFFIEQVELELEPSHQIVVSPIERSALYLGTNKNLVLIRLIICMTINNERMKTLSIGGTAISSTTSTAYRVTIITVNIKDFHHGAKANGSTLSLFHIRHLLYNLFWKVVFPLKNAFAASTFLLLLLS